MKLLQAHFHSVENMILKQLGISCMDIIQELESQEYGACSFVLENYSVRFRVAKITPMKTGQFVTFWKRIGNSQIMPFDATDAIDFFMVSVQKDNNCGLFIFPQPTLIAHNVVSKHGKGGKRAMRVYPLWDIVSSKQAQASQAWQLRYFIVIEPDGSCDQASLEKLLQITV